MDGSDYETLRNERIARNRALLESLGIPKITAPPTPPATPKPKSRKRAREEDDFADGGSEESEGDESPTRAKKRRATSARRSERRAGRVAPPAADLPAEDDDGEPAKPKKRWEGGNVYGSIPGVEVGRWWMYRDACCADGVHRLTVAGIHPGPHGAHSVALSGGYEDDVDLGEAFTYTGEGGRDLKGTKAAPKNLRTAPQSKDQDPNSRGNRALIRSAETGNPVRVIRGYKLAGKYSPGEGYRYDGLYRVVKHWTETGASGFKVLKFAFKRDPGQPAIPVAEGYE